MGWHDGINEKSMTCLKRIMANDTWNFTERMACTLNVSLYFLPDQEKYNYIVIIRTHIFGSYTEKENKDGNMDKIFFYTKTKIYSNTAIKHAHDNYVY